MKKIVFILFSILLINGCSDSVRHPDEIDAHFFCNKQIKERLKSPKSAEFPYTSQIEVIENIKIDTDDFKEIDFIVNGYFDASNSFGAMIRSKFTCKISGQTGNYWKITGLEIF